MQSKMQRPIICDSLNCRWVYLCIAWVVVYRQPYQRRRTGAGTAYNWVWVGRKRRVSRARRTVASVTPPATRTVGNPVSHLHPWWWTTNTILLHTAVAVHVLAVFVRESVSRRLPRVCYRGAIRAGTVIDRASPARTRSVPLLCLRDPPSIRSSLTSFLGT